MLIFLYQFNNAEMHSQKSFSRFFRKPIPNEQALLREKRWDLAWVCSGDNIRNFKKLIW